MKMVENRWKCMKIHENAWIKRWKMFKINENRWIGSPRWKLIKSDELMNEDEWLIEWRCKSEWVNDRINEWMSMCACVHVWMSFSLSFPFFCFNKNDKKISSFFHIILMFNLFLVRRTKFSLCFFGCFFLCLFLIINFFSPFYEFSWIKTIH